MNSEITSEQILSLQTGEVVRYTKGTWIKCLDAAAGAYELHYTDSPDDACIGKPFAYDAQAAGWVADVSFGSGKFRTRFDGKRYSTPNLSEIPSPRYTSAAEAIANTPG